MRNENNSLRATLRHEAAAEILACYGVLAEQGKHLLWPLLDGSPVQWAHYPESDAIDRRNGYQYFYHSHSPDDREGLGEHGHFHLFARVDNQQHELDFTAEQNFLETVGGGTPVIASTINLLGISLDAKGVPTTLFTVNRWVTGDHLLSAAVTLPLLSRFKVDVKEYDPVNQWLAAMVQLFWPQIEDLLLERDAKLIQLADLTRNANLLDDETIEVLSSISIDLNEQVASLLMS
ncbi:MAG: hypothetical protein HYZ18_06420 [Pseudogulbenkiania sp.]|nr:hypothetical protein [Pseudogulbenkiania sp.]